MSILLKVRVIDASKYKFAEFAALSLYFLGKDNAGQLVYTALKCEIYLVKGLWANLLISNNILSPKGFVIDIGRKSALIGSCGVTITINAKQQKQLLARKLRAAQDIFVLPCSETIVSLHQVLLPDNWDFLFHPIIQANLTLYSYIVDHETSKVLVKNTSDQPLRIFWRHKRGHPLDIAYDNYFLVDTQLAHDLTVFPPSL